jgi:hypothetical protein
VSFRWVFRMIDNQYLDGRLAWREFQAELFLHRRKK